MTILGFFAETGTELRANLLEFLSSVVPPSASALIYQTVDEIAANADDSSLWFGIISALWFASLGIAALSDALNATYVVRESRAWWHVRFSAIGLTVALAVLIISALLLLL